MLASGQVRAMKLTFLKAGRFAHDEAASWAQTYLARLKRSFTVDFRQLKDGTLPKTLQDLRQKPDVLLVLLDERGKATTTNQWADRLGAWRNDGTVQEVVFAVG